MQNSVLSLPVLQVKPHCSRKVPLHIHLGEHLANPADLACAEAVVSYLSAQVSRTVALRELEGLSLYLWSEDEVDGRGLVEYAENGLPLQGLLLNTLELSGESSAPRVRIRIESADLGPFVGQRFVFAVEVPSCA
jgi:hypothetical protein